MIGLILKDFINLKKNFKIMGLLVIFYGFMSLSMKGTSFFASMITLVFAMLFMATYSFDEAAKWDGYALTMPISKENIIQGKYLSVLLLTALGFTISSIMQILLNIIGKADNLFSGLQVSTIGAALVILFYSITIPIITKIGIEKARLAFFIIYMLPFLFVTVVFDKLKEIYPEPPEMLVRMAKGFVDNIYVIVPLVVLLALCISYKISINIYKKREF